MADQVRLDKWLWAARFFKTRTLAKAAIEGGKVHCNGARVKSSKPLTVGTTHDIRQGFAIKAVIVEALSDKRGPASDAERLYTETPESIQKRETEAHLRKINKTSMPNPQKPNKKERRKIIAFKQQ